MSGSGGYTASTEAMSSASKKIGQLAQDLVDNNPDLSATKVDDKGFGEAHGEHAKQYTEGVKTLSDAVNGYSTTLTTLGTNLSSGAQSYDENEAGQSGSINQAGTL
ncbi:hypothetical protein GCM10022222_04230 [Amycolatopsis ultiminotia]|uniref:Excreted virulence factor EspC, type VII ESX diderm n=1 Tax=Amycolatopsis ultiminotia TaxID=543629 RepID=A0ABP6V2D5_9PSEU